MNIDRPITIRPAAADDVTAMMRLQGSSNTAAHWSEQQYQSLIQRGDSITRLALVAESKEDSAILGFLVAQPMGPEWELENIIVDPEFQGKGIGTSLLNELFTRAQHANSDAVFLEVRESNRAARGLYEKLGFRETGRRKSYYSNPLEDAILYCKRLEGVG